MNMSEKDLEKAAAATGKSVEEVKEKSDAIDRAIKTGADFIITTVEGELGIKLTDEQKEKFAHIYAMSFMMSSMVMVH